MSNCHNADFCWDNIKIWEKISHVWKTELCVQCSMQDSCMVSASGTPEASKEGKHFLKILCWLSGISMVHSIIPLLFKKVMTCCFSRWSWWKYNCFHVCVYDCIASENYFPEKPYVGQLGEKLLHKSWKHFVYKPKYPQTVIKTRKKAKLWRAWKILDSALTVSLRVNKYTSKKDGPLSVTEVFFKLASPKWACF